MLHGSQYWNTLPIGTIGTSTRVPWYTIGVDTRASPRVVPWYVLEDVSSLLRCCCLYTCTNVHVHAPPTNVLQELDVRTRVVVTKNNERAFLDGLQVPSVQSGAGDLLDAERLDAGGRRGGRVVVHHHGWSGGWVS